MPPRDEYVFDSSVLPDDPVPDSDRTLTALRRLSPEQVTKLKDTILQTAGPSTTITIVPWENDDIAARDDIFRMSKARHNALGDRRTRFYDFYIDRTHATR